MKKELFGESKKIAENIRRDEFLQRQLAVLESTAEEYRECGIQSLTYTGFKCFYETGSRKEYEYEYFSRRRLLNALAVLSVVNENDEEYISRLENTLWAVLDEFTWALPAHIPADMPIEGCITRIDLFAAETAFTLAEILRILGDRLDGTVKCRIEYEVRRRVLQPYLNGQRNSWDTLCNNWAAVCGGSVGGVFLYLADDNEIEAVLPRLKKTLECYLDGFGNDGACTEGINYWIYGFGYFTYFAELLYQYTRGKDDLFDNEKVRSIALFQQKIRFKNNRTVTFSDSGDGFIHRSGLSHFLARRYNGITVPDDSSALGAEDDACFRFAHLIRDFAWRTEIQKPNYNSDDSFEYFADAAWYIRKTENYEFAAKAGNNNESHNHNDIGSFLMNAHEQCIITDPGRGEYTAEYFGKGRYAYFAPSALAHSVPVINEKLQCEGSDRTGVIKKADKDKLVIDFERAYDDEGLKRLTRSFMFRKDGILIRDEFVFCDSPEKITEHFVTEQMPYERGGEVIIGNTVMRYNTDMFVCRITEKSFASGYNTAKTVYMIDLDSVKPQTEYTAIIELIYDIEENHHE